MSQYIVLQPRPAGKQEVYLRTRIGSVDRLSTNKANLYHKNILHHLNCVARSRMVSIATFSMSRQLLENTLTFFWLEIISKTHLTNITKFVSSFYMNFFSQYASCLLFNSFLGLRRDQKAGYWVGSGTWYEPYFTKASGALMDLVTHAAFVPLPPTSECIGCLGLH